MAVDILAKHAVTIVLYCCIDKPQTSLKSAPPIGLGLEATTWMPHNMNDIRYLDNYGHA